MSLFSAGLRMSPDGLCDIGEAGKLTGGRSASISRSGVIGADSFGANGSLAGVSLVDGVIGPDGDPGRRPAGGKSSATEPGSSFSASSTGT